jgi:MFS family permease
MRPFTALYPSLSVRAFRLLWLGMLPSLLAFQIGVVATGFAAVTLSDSALAVGVVGGAWGLPVLLLPLVGGVAADRYSRRHLLLLSHLVIGVAWLLVAVLASSGRLEIWHLVVLGLIQGISFSFMTPARVAFTAAVVGPALLPNAVAAFYASMNVAIILGPILAGLTISSEGLGLGWAYFIAAVLYGLVLLVFLRLPEAPTIAADGRATAGKQLMDGLRYIRSTSPIPFLMILAASASLLGLPYVQLMPVFADRVFGVGAAGLGFLLAAGGLGALVGSIAAARITSGALWWWQRALGVTIGVQLAVFGVSPNFAVALTVALTTGMATAAFGIVNNSLVMTASAPPFYGRVMSVYQLTFGLGPVAAVPLAWLADQIGAPQAVAACGLLLVLTTLALTRRTQPLAVT